MHPIAHTASLSLPLLYRILIGSYNGENITERSSSSNSAASDVPSRKKRKKSKRRRHSSHYLFPSRFSPRAAAEYRAAFQVYSRSRTARIYIYSLAASLSFTREQQRASIAAPWHVHTHTERSVIGTRVIVPSAIRLSRINLEERERAAE